MQSVIGKSFVNMFHVATNTHSRKKLFYGSSVPYVVRVVLYTQSRQLVFLHFLANMG
jgi:hypothetical protein